MVIARIEATDLGADACFIVTNLSGRGKTLYETVYCQRGAIDRPVWWAQHRRNTELVVIPRLTTLHVDPNV